MNSIDQPRLDKIKNVLYSGGLYFLHSRKKFSILILYNIFLYRSQPYWHFSFSSSERYISLTSILTLLSFSSSERFWYFSRASFWSFSLFFFIIVICHFYIYRKKNLKILYQFFYTSIFMNHLKLNKFFCKIYSANILTSGQCCFHFEDQRWNSVDPTLKMKQNLTPDFQRCTTLIQCRYPTLLKQRWNNVDTTVSRPCFNVSSTLVKATSKPVGLVISTDL